MRGVSNLPCLDSRSWSARRPNVDRDPETFLNKGIRLHCDKVIDQNVYNGFNKVRCIQAHGRGPTRSAPISLTVRPERDCPDTLRSRRTCLDAGGGGKPRISSRTFLAQLFAPSELFLIARSLLNRRLKGVGSITASRHVVGHAALPAAVPDAG